MEKLTKTCSALSAWILQKIAKESYKRTCLRGCGQIEINVVDPVEENLFRQLKQKVLPYYEEQGKWSYQKVW